LAGEHDEVAVLAGLQAAQLSFHAERPRSAERCRAKSLLQRHAHCADSEGEHHLHILAVRGTGIEVGSKGNGEAEV